MDFGQVITELVPTILGGGAPGVPARPLWCRTGETPVPPSPYVDRDIANECTVSLNTLPRCS